MEVCGRSFLIGFLKIIIVIFDEMFLVLEEFVLVIIEVVYRVLENILFEFAVDIILIGIVMIGGGSFLWGFDKLIFEKIGILIRIVDDFVLCVVFGIGKVLEVLDVLEVSFIKDLRVR